MVRGRGLIPLSYAGGALLMRPALLPCAEKKERSPSPRRYRLL